jgi:hypothetical protein
MARGSRSVGSQVERLEWSAQRHAVGARIGGLADHQAGAAGLQRQHFVIFLVERIARPQEEVQPAVGAEAQAEIGQRVAGDVGIGRARRVRRELRARAAVVAEVEGAVAAEHAAGHIIFGAIRNRPLGHARQPLAGDVADDRARAAGRAGGSRHAGGHRAAGQLGRAGRVGEADIFRIGVGAVDIAAEPAAGAEAAVQLQPLHAHLAGVRQIAANDGDLAVVHGRLIVFDARAEGGEVQRDLAIGELRFQAQLEVIDLLRLDRLRGEIDAGAGGVQRQAGQVDAARLEAARIGRIAMHVAREVIGQRQVAGEVPVAELRLIALRGQRAALIGLHAGERRRAVERRAAAGQDGRHIGAALLVVVDAHAGLDAQAVRHLPGQLAEGGEAGVLEADVVDRGQPVQHRRIVGVGARRVEQEAARRRALHLRTAGVDRLVEGEQPRDIVELVAAAGIAEFLRPLPLLRRVLRHRGDRQAGEVAIVLRRPVPEAPGGDRGQRAAAQLQLAAQRRAADDLLGLDRRVEIGDAVERVGAGRHIVVERRGERRELAVERPLGGAGADVDLHAAIRVLAVIVAGQRQVERIGRLPQQRAAHTEIVLAVDVLLGGDVVDRALARGGGRTQPDRDIVRQRAADRGLGLIEAEVAGGHLHRAFGREARRLGGDVDRAGGGVLAVERALRPAQHLDALDVEEVESRRAGAGVIDLVDIEADARLDAVVDQAERLAEAADVDRRVARVGRIELQRRLDLRELEHVERAGLFDARGIDHRDRQRHVLHRLGAPARGDQQVGIGVPGLRDRGRVGAFGGPGRRGDRRQHARGKAQQPELAGVAPALRNGHFIPPLMPTASRRTIT